MMMGSWIVVDMAAALHSVGSAPAKVLMHLQDGRNVTLEDVCYKPFAGGACATQSLLQFWRMDRSIYKKGDPVSHTRLSAEYCLSHWSTACRGAYGGPQARAVARYTCLQLEVETAPLHVCAIATVRRCVLKRSVMLVCVACLRIPTQCWAASRWTTSSETSVPTPQHLW